MSVMTKEVFIAAMHRGGPGVLALVALLGGAMLPASGVLLLLIALLIWESAPLWRAIRHSLGL